MNNIYKSAKLYTYGETVEGLDDISQSIGVIVTTQKGSVPLEPLFGVDHLQYIDKPLDVIRGQYTAAIMEALLMWELRADIRNVTLEQTGSELHIVVVWAPVNGNIVKTDNYTVIYA